MPPKFFVPIVYLHLLAGTGVTFASSEYPMGSGPFYNIGIVVGSFACLFALLQMSPGPLKYAVAALMCAFLGQTLAPLMKKLGYEKLLAQTLIGTLGVFGAMSAIGFYDNQNLLGFGPYLFAALVGLLLARLGAAFLAPPEEAKTANTIFSWVGAILFAAYTAYDTQRLKKDAKAKASPDYIESSLDLYLDFLNLFQSIGSLEQ
jgi:FtsH-binding integral membrane protein